MHALDEILKKKDRDTIAKKHVTNIDRINVRVRKTYYEYLEVIREYVTRWWISICKIEERRPSFNKNEIEIFERR